METAVGSGTRPVGAGTLADVGAPPGLQTDCEALLSRFQELDSVRFEDFAELWRSMKFATIFCGKMRNLKKNMFTKEALALAWRYFLPPYTFQIRVGALYLLYGLYNTQLCQPKQKLSCRMKKKIQQTEVTQKFKDPNDRVMKLITSDVLEEMLNVHDHYQNMKRAISADKSMPDKALSLVKEDFFDNIKNIVLEHQQWHKDRKNPSLKAKLKEGEEDSEGTSQEPERCERAESLAKIKAKAFSAVAQVSKSRRHRQAKLDSSDSDSGSGQGKGKAAKKKRTRETAAERAGGKKASRSTGNVQNEWKEEKSLHLSMPIIAEEEEETGNDVSEAEFTAPKRKRKR
ncbi:snRNA-activating protein complex subunit 1 isoform X2 [Phodopus roborovskii]|uniref:snRNA-activating protein complex subunit 1 isoform X2 n=1 Tax=Phodopus roborovskii TaxID=109678 RepID=UPI0021E3F857|nr:snRNA-activating protein complex subunit 1 isoform X2 [Phodopus roborovskii]